MFSETDNLSGKAFSDDRTKKISAKQKHDEQNSPAMFRRIAAADMNAVRECVDNYGNLVWSLAKKLTDSTEEAETATQEIFLDLWKNADRFERTKFGEETFIFLIAYRCLTKGKVKSVAGTEEVVF